MAHPIRNRFTVPYGAAFGANRAGGKRKHAATDYHCPIGTPIYGTGDGGRVTFIGYAPDPWLGLGWNIRVAYPGGRSTVDAHMRERPVVGVGAAVNSGTLLGYVGITGNAVNADPPGSHDHHELRINGTLTNPLAYYGNVPAGGGSVVITPPIDTRDEFDMATLQEVRDIIRDEMKRSTRYEFIQSPDGTVWLSVDRTFRYAIPSPRNLDTYRAFLKDLGYGTLPIVAKAKDDMAAYGTPVYADLGYIARAVDAELADDFAAPPSSTITLTEAQFSELAERFAARVGLDAQEVSESFRIILDEQLATLPVEVADEQAKRLTN